MNTRRSANVPAQLETECVRQGSDPRSSRKERPRRRRNTSNRKQKCSTAKAFGKCSLQPRDESLAAPSVCVWPNFVDYTPNPELVQCSGVEMGSLSFFWPRSMRDHSSPTNTNGTRAPCTVFLTGRCVLVWGLRSASSHHNWPDFHSPPPSSPREEAVNGGPRQEGISSLLCQCWHRCKRARCFPALGSLGLRKGG